MQENTQERIGNILKVITESDIQREKNNKNATKVEKCCISANPLIYSLKPIGYIRSLHHEKNGTPRQGSVSSLSRGRLQIEKSIFNNPEHSLEGLKEYSHVWIIFIFHRNNNKSTHAKVSPPRLNGLKVGVLSTRSPHRPNPVGLTLAKLEDVQGDTLMLSGIDIIDETPVIDVKPFIPQYDTPGAFRSLEVSFNSEKHRIDSPDKLDTDFDSLSLSGSQSSSRSVQSDDKSISSKTTVGIDSETTRNDLCPFKYHSTNGSKLSMVSVPKWTDSEQRMEVIFNPIAEQEIQKFSRDAEDPRYRLEYLQTSSELKAAISTVLSEDPRSVYRREKCADRLYYVSVDTAHVTTFTIDYTIEVLRVSPLEKGQPCDGIK